MGIWPSRGSNAQSSQTGQPLPNDEWVRWHSNLLLREWLERFPPPETPSLVKNVTMLGTSRLAWYQWAYPKGLQDAIPEEFDCNYEWGQLYMCRTIRNRVRMLYSTGSASQECENTFPKYLQCMRAKDESSFEEVLERRNPPPYALDRHPWKFKPRYIQQLRIDGRLKEPENLQQQQQQPTNPRTENPAAGQQQ